VKRLAVAVALALALAGCPGIPRVLERPTVSVRGVALVSASLSGLDLRVDFDITNPNTVGLPLRAVDWEVSVGGSSSLRGRVDLTETIPAKASAPASASVHISPSSAASMISRIAAGARDVHAEGVLHFETSLGSISAPFAIDTDLSE
jgi:LEA14-like dessication related protein